MITARLAVLATLLVASLRQRTRQLRDQPERGGHAVEYAVGVGGSAAIILGVIAAVKLDLAGVMASWLFK